MCIIAYVPKGEDITRGTLQNCYWGNKDGAGFMYAKDGKITIRKGYFSFNSFYKDFKRARKIDVDIVTHFRIATHGSITKGNCHPYLVDKSLAFAHNGIIPIDVPEKEDVSDTAIFNRNVLRNLPRGFLMNKGIMELIREYISYSKLCFLDNTGNVTIVNENDGVWDEGCWFSNTSYMGYMERQIRPKIKNDYWDAIAADYKSIHNQALWCKKCGLELILDEDFNQMVCVGCRHESK